MTVRSRALAGGIGVAVLAGALVAGCGSPDAPGAPALAGGIATTVGSHPLRPIDRWFPTTSGGDALYTNLAETQEIERQLQVELRDAGLDDREAQFGVAYSPGTGPPGVPPPITYWFAVSSPVVPAADLQRLYRFGPIGSPTINATTTTSLPSGNVTVLSVTQPLGDPWWIATATPDDHTVVGVASPMSADLAAAQAAAMLGG